MNSEKFLAVIESNLTPMAPEFIPGLIKKQLDNLEMSYKSMTPGHARIFISNVSDALALFIGPAGSHNAKKFMMKELRECCDESERSLLMEIR